MLTIEWPADITLPAGVEAGKGWLWPDLRCIRQVECPEPYQAACNCGECKLDHPHG